LGGTPVSRKVNEPKVAKESEEEEQIVLPQEKQLQLP